MALTPAASSSSWSASWSHRLPCCCCCSGRLDSTPAQQCPRGLKTFRPICSIYRETSCWGVSFPSTISPVTSPRGRCRTTSAAKGKLMIASRQWTLTEADPLLPLLAGHTAWTITDWVWPLWWSTLWMKWTQTRLCCRASSWVMKFMTRASSLLL